MLINWILDIPLIGFFLKLYQNSEHRYTIFLAIIEILYLGITCDFPKTFNPMPLSLHPSSTQASPAQIEGVSVYSPSRFGKRIVVHARQTCKQQTDSF